MERQFVRCPECDDHMEAEYRKGRWVCENCGTDLTDRVESNMRREQKSNRKNRR